jgi:uncharacterized LabA/DUF88 family protein
MAASGSFPVIPEEPISRPLNFSAGARRPIHPSQRVAIFVDVQNMYYAARDQYQRKLNFEALRDLIVAGRNLTRATCYIVEAPESDQRGFISVLLQTGYEVKSKELRRRADGSAKGDWDMGIAIDSISMSDKVDVIALVSGDGDFKDLVNHLKARGVRVEVYSFPGSTSDDLRQTATEYVALDEGVLLY